MNIFKRLQMLRYRIHDIIAIRKNIKKIRASRDKAFKDCLNKLRAENGKDPI